MVFVLSAFAGTPDSSNTIRLRVDIRNLISNSGQEEYPKEKFLELFREVNAVYAKCSVQFVPRNIDSIPASNFDVSFPPKSEEDMAALAARLNPQGFGKINEAFPLTFAGNFYFFSPNYQVYVKGLTWAFLNGPSDIKRMHSMIGRQHLDGTQAVEIVAHELGHFFLLPHSAVDGNVMGAGRDFTAEQCRQIRTMAANYYQALTI